MSKLGKKLAGAGLTLCLALGTLAGCAGNDKTVIKVNGDKLSYGEVNFMLRYYQVQTQAMYAGLFGEEMWNSFGDTAKSSIVEDLENMLLQEQHMEDYGVSLSDGEKESITAAAEKFMESNTEDTIEAMTADQETVERILTLYTVEDKMKEAIIADVDTAVSDEEAAQTTVRYVFFSTADTTNSDGTTTAMTDEEKQAVKDKAQQVLDDVKSGTEMNEAIKKVDENKASTTASYGKDNGSLDEAIKEAVEGLKDGECAESLVESENGYYVAQMEASFDEEATEKQKETIAKERQDEKYNETLEGWREESDISVKDSLLKDMSFTDDFQMLDITGETESEAQTEGETTVQTENQTETAAE